MGKRKAIVLLSGGIDSATTLAWAKKEGFATHALTFHYGQRHACEVAAASRIAHALQATSHEIVELPSGLFWAFRVDGRDPRTERAVYG